MLVKLIKSFIFLSVVFVSSFGTCNTKNDEEKIAQLEILANERWDTIINYDFGATYEFATPKYREVFTKDLYVSQFSYGVAWNLTKIEDIKYDRATDVAVVTVLVETKPRNSKGLDATVKTASVKIREKWLHIKGRWWHSSSE